MASQLLPCSELAEALRAGAAALFAHAPDRRHRARRPGLDRDHRSGLATLVVAKFLAWLLIVSAIAEFYLAFQVHGGWRIAGAVLTGLVSLVAGVWLLLNRSWAPGPHPPARRLLRRHRRGEGRRRLSSSARSSWGWGWALASAIASIVLGLIVFSGWPGTALWVLGLMVGHRPPVLRLGAARAQGGGEPLSGRVPARIA